MRKSNVFSRENAEALAIQALAFIADDPERLDRFLVLSGIGPEQIRTAAAEPGFLAGVLDHLSSDETLIIEFSKQAGIEPEAVEGARRAIVGRDWEREVP
ncbi:MAG TPA: DUF3572 domain-containing protein [Xanthobacteraceae bacterium]|jgi:hypothetical protein|nr:DUF3572 domain-containing protein [Xanthobacteraceae bacterium]